MLLRREVFKRCRGLKRYRKYYKRATISGTNKLVERGKQLLVFFRRMHVKSAKFQRNKVENTMTFSPLFKRKDLWEGD
jgi:hypothetical protein